MAFKDFIILSYLALGKNSRAMVTILFVLILAITI